MFSRERLNFVSVILDAGRKCRGKFIVTRIKKEISTAYSFFFEYHAYRLFLYGKLEAGVEKCGEASFARHRKG